MSTATTSPAAGAAAPPATLNGWLRWFRALTWVGIVVNLAGFVLPALFTPDILETTLGPGMVELSYVWVAAAGMLLLFATLFYIPAAKDPLRYHVFAWLAVLGRGIAATFWIWTDLRWHLPGMIETFWITDGAFCVIFLVLLLKGMPKPYNLSAANLSRGGRLLALDAAGQQRRGAVPRPGVARRAAQPGRRAQRCSSRRPGSPPSSAAPASPRPTCGSATAACCWCSSRCSSCPRPTTRCATTSTPG